MNRHLIKIPIYNGILHLFDCKDSREALKEIKGEECDEEDSVACLFWDHSRNPGNWWLCIDLQDSSEGLLVHELFHATHRILEYFDVQFMSNNHEPFAYLIEYLFNESIKIKKRNEKV